ncbi:MAG: YdcH family protein [Acidobacteriaceae bacterium]
MQDSVQPSSRTATRSPRPNPLGRLVEEHRHYTRKLENILAQSYLSESEQVEAARLKKMKLRLKDEMKSYAYPSRSDSMQG